MKTEKQVQFLFSSRYGREINDTFDEWFESENLASAGQDLLDKWETFCDEKPVFMAYGEGKRSLVVVDDDPYRLAALVSDHHFVQESTDREHLNFRFFPDSDTYHFDINHYIVVEMFPTFEVAYQRAIEFKDINGVEPQMMKPIIDLDKLS